MSCEADDTLAIRLDDAMAGLAPRSLSADPRGNRGHPLAKAAAALRGVVSRHDGLLTRRAGLQAELERERLLGMQVASALDRLERCGEDAGEDEVAAMRVEVERAIAAWEGLRPKAPR